MGYEQATTTTADGTERSPLRDPYAVPLPHRRSAALPPRQRSFRRVLVALIVTASICVWAAVVVAGSFVMWPIVLDILRALTGCFAPTCY